MSLYLKYRPKTIDELDLSNIREYFHGVVKSGRVAHAYLFDGPRGAGKTSSARILAKMLNCEKGKGEVCEPCGECESCVSITNGSAVDIVEIDGASNRRIDDIRDLKDKIRLAPTRFRKKVYIIDEVHMLTTEAFNALLKTLEEPPERVVFVLATTEFHKLPETIVSRCVRLRFRKASVDEMVRSLSRVVKGEGVKINDDALRVLASGVDGSFRDGVKVLEQLLGSGDVVSVESVNKVLYGTASDRSMPFVDSLLRKDMVSAISTVRVAESEGESLRHLLYRSMVLLRDGLLRKYGVESDEGVSGDMDLSSLDVSDSEVIDLVKKMDEVASSLDRSVSERLLIEVMVIDWCGSGGVHGVGGSDRGRGDDGHNSSGIGGRSSGSGEDKDRDKGKDKDKDKDKDKNVSGDGGIGDGVDHHHNHDDVGVDVKGDGSNGVGEGGVGGGDVDGGGGSVSVSMSGDEVEMRWRKVMQEARRHYSLGALLSTAKIVKVEGSELVIGVQFDFHRQQLENSKFRDQIEKLLSSVFGFPMTARFCVYDGSGGIGTAPNNVSGGGDDVSGEGGEDVMELAKEVFGVS